MVRAPLRRPTARRAHSSGSSTSSGMEGGSTMGSGTAAPPASAADARHQPRQAGPWGGGSAPPPRASPAPTPGVSAMLRCRSREIEQGCRAMRPRSIKEVSGCGGIGGEERARVLFGSRCPRSDAPRPIQPISTPSGASIGLFDCSPRGWAAHAPRDAASGRAPLSDTAAPHHGGGLLLSS